MTMAKKPEPHTIIQRAWKRAEARRNEEITVFKLTRESGISWGNISRQMKGERSWSAEKWLQTLDALGAIRKLKNEIVIDI